MNNLSKEIVNNDGSKGVVVATSEDNYGVKIDEKYALSNHKIKKESKLAKKFKGSLLGADIGVKNSGFSSMASLAVVIALTVVFILYLLWRF